MNRKILFTSFTTWLPHQKSNSSDDLLKEILNLRDRDSFLTCLRGIPRSSIGRGWIAGNDLSGVTNLY